MRSVIERFLKIERIALPSRQVDALEKEAPKAKAFIESIPRIVCLCGSTRFNKQFQKANLDETLKGNIVLTVGCFMHSDSELGFTEGSDIKKRLDELHKRKIDLCDDVFVLNVGGYIGESTRSEIEYAQKIGKPISYLEDTP